MNFDNQVVIVTGGTRGIGLATVKAFYKANAHVILFGSKAKTVLEALNKLKQENIYPDGYFPNLNDYQEIEDVIHKIYEKYGHIDILINNAGISDSKALEDITSSDFDNIMNINVKAMFNMCKAVVPIMKKQKNGVILNTSSFVSIYGQARGVGYPTSKFAVNGLTKSLALELAPFNIRVNAVAPGIIKTDMVANLDKEMIEPLIKKIPLGRIGEDLDIANAFLFLASNMASYITGVILNVDGAMK